MKLRFQSMCLQWQPLPAADTPMAAVLTWVGQGCSLLPTVFSSQLKVEPSVTLRSNLVEVSSLSLYIARLVCTLSGFVHG